MGMKQGLGLTRIWSYLLLLTIIVFHSASEGLSSLEGYIIAGSDGGLSNRLRVLVAYMHISKVLYNAELLFIWDVNAACPGHFLEIFRPLQGVTFIGNFSVEALRPAAKASFPISRDHFEYIMMTFDIPKNRYGFISWWDIQTNGYGKLHPVPYIQKRANDFIIKENICNASSMHLRQTDMYKILKPKRRASVESFDRFVDSRPSEEKIYLMTDNPESQRRFIDKFGAKKILVYAEMGNMVGNVSISHDSEGQIYSQIREGSNVSIPEEFRYSTLEHLLVDIIIASHAHVFKGTPFSSASDLVNIYRRAHPSLCCDGANNALCLHSSDAMKMFQLEHAISIL